MQWWRRFLELVLLRVNWLPQLLAAVNHQHFRVCAWCVDLRQQVLILFTRLVFGATYRLINLYRCLSSTWRARSGKWT